MAFTAAQIVLPGRERAHESQDRLDRDERDRGEVGRPERLVVGEAPAGGDADPDGREAPDDEDDEGGVYYEDRIGEQRDAQEAMNWAPAFAGATPAVGRFGPAVGVGYG